MTAIGPAEAGRAVAVLQPTRVAALAARPEPESDTTGRAGIIGTLGIIGIFSRSRPGFVQVL
jgi:hypothetical protein